MHAQRVGGAALVVAVGEEAGERFAQLSRRPRLGCELTELLGGEGAGGLAVAQQHGGERDVFVIGDGRTVAVAGDGSCEVRLTPGRGEPVDAGPGPADRSPDAWRQQRGDAPLERTRRRRRPDRRLAGRVGDHERPSLADGADELAGGAGDRLTGDGRVRRPRDDREVGAVEAVAERALGRGHVHGAPREQRLQRRRALGERSADEELALRLVLVGDVAHRPV